MKKLNDYPKALEVIMSSFLRDLNLSVKEDNNVSEDFKESLLLKGVLVENLQTMMEVSPSLYFKVFDENKLYISIVPVIDVDTTRFRAYINNDSYGSIVDNRLEADRIAVEIAIEFLEQRLNSSQNETEAQP